MSTENETWRDASSAEENSGAGRDGNQFNKEGGYSVRLTTVIMATVLIVPDLIVKTATARSVLITVTALIARALILVRTMVTVRSVLVTITIMATVPIVRAITAKAATVRNVLMETIRVTVLTVRATTAKVATVRNALIIVTVRSALATIMRVVTVRNVLITVTAPTAATVLIIRTVPIVRATTAKMATVRSVLATIMRVVTVLIVHASIRVVEDLADTATETAIAVQSVVRPIMTPMLSTARRNR